MTAPTYAPRLMRTPEAARYLGISATTLRRLDLPTRRLSDGIVVYDRHDLDRYADALPPAECGHASATEVAHYIAAADRRRVLTAKEAET